MLGMTGDEDEQPARRRAAIMIDVLAMIEIVRHKVKCRKE